MRARRYDLDWMRVLAIGLLIIYHSAIGFQSWGALIGFIPNTEKWNALWLPMTIINVWRIPLLFCVSGMSLFLALNGKTWKQLLNERFIRIGIPLLFGVLVIVPLHILLLQFYYKQQLSYKPHLGHLWFLGNILIYTVVVVFLYFLLKKRNKAAAIALPDKLLKSPLVFLGIMVLFMAEAELLRPASFETYAFTGHGFALGGLAFATGFWFMQADLPFWKMLLRWRWFFGALALGLYINRIYAYPEQIAVYLTALESCAWLFCLTGFAYRYLNVPGKTLDYLREAVFPVYLLHMVVLYLGSVWLFPLNLSAPLKFILLVLFTLTGTFALYELLIRRVALLRILFGLKRLKPFN